MTSQAAPTPVPSPVHPLSPGTGPAPDFTLPDQHGAGFSLSDELTRRPVLLVFYPYAFSRICGGELRELRDARQNPDLRDVSIVAISCDAMYSLRVYAEQEGFEFPLLADFWPHGGVARAYGVFDEEKGCARRGSFLIDQDRSVRWSVVNPISEPRPLTSYLAAVSALNPTSNPTSA